MEREVVELGTHQTTILMWALNDYINNRESLHRDVARQVQELIRECAEEGIGMVPAVTMF